MNQCKHNSGFSLVHSYSLENYAQFVCNLNCGYTMNFDPSTFPYGVSYVLYEVKDGDRTVRFTTSKW